VPIQITELNSSSALRDEKAALALFKADISVIVWNPLTTPLTVLLTSIAALNNPNTLLAITSSSSTTQLHAHIESLIQQHLDEVKTIFIDPWRALRAHEILESDSASPLSVQRFQDDFTESRISSISDFLNDIFAQVDPIHTSTNHTIMTSNAFGTYAALSRIRSALVMCQKSLRDSERKMDIVRTSVSNLRMQIEEVKMKAHRKVLGISGEVVGASRAEDMDEVGKALNDTEKKLKEVLDWLTWWRMLWRVDEIGIIVGDAVDKAWCNDLEKKVGF
jgi:hypothetical protein